MDEKEKFPHYLPASEMGERSKGVSNWKTTNF